MIFSRIYLCYNLFHIRGGKFLPVNPIPYFLPTPSSSLGIISLFLLSVNVSVLYTRFDFIFRILYVIDIIWHLFFLDVFYQSILIPRFINNATNWTIFQFFFMAEYNVLCVCVPSFLVRSSVVRHLGCFMSWLL